MVNMTKRRAYILRKVFAQRPSPRAAFKYEPFPGKYPTRLCFTVQFTNGKPDVKYLGKPTRAVIELYVKLATHPKLKGCWAVEFDRKFTEIQEHSAFGPDRVSHLGLANTWSHVLTATYHPFTPVHSFMGHLNGGRVAYVPTHAGRYKFYAPPDITNGELIAVVNNYKERFPEGVRTKTTTVGVRN